MESQSTDLFDKVAQPKEARRWLCFSPFLHFALWYVAHSAQLCFPPGTALVGALQPPGRMWLADPLHSSFFALIISKATKQTASEASLKQHSASEAFLWLSERFYLQTWYCPAVAETFLLKNIILSREMVSHHGWSLSSPRGKEGGKNDLSWVLASAFAWTCSLLQPWLSWRSVGWA